MSEIDWLNGWLAKKIHWPPNKTLEILLRVGLHSALYLLSPFLLVIAFVLCIVGLILVSPIIWVAGIWQSASKAAADRRAHAD